MAYITHYKYDIFISYAHLDNKEVLNESKGWIKDFFDELNLLLSRRIGKADVITFWWDEKKIDGGIAFDQFIDESIKQSAIMICLVSESYLQSPYCNDELQSFYNKALHEPEGMYLNNRSRILNVLLNNIPHEEWPKELNGATGFKFNDAVEKTDFGDPVEAGSKEFKAGLKQLREAIIKLFEEFQAFYKSDLFIPVDKFTIFFGDVSDSLRPLKKLIAKDLRIRGFELISDIPPPYEDAEHEEIVKERLTQARLSVHLLDQYPGREIEGKEIISYPQRQAELGFESPGTQLIWVPLDMNITDVEDEQYKTFLQGLESGKQASKSIKYIRGIRSELTQQIIDISNNIQAQEKQPSKEKLSVLLDTHYVDQLYALELSKLLVKNGIQPYVNPEEDDPQKNITVLNDRIGQVSKLIFFYGEVSLYWISERIKAALQLIVSNNYPKKDFYILMIPPHKKMEDLPPFETRYLPINIINCSDAFQIDSATLQVFFKSINALT